jgi:aryl-alcohol dehydrogenase-like predicted oxidoreductase
VRDALDNGINFFDTADVYGLGESERQLSKALGSQRHEVVIATKFGVRWNQRHETWKDISPSYLVDALEKSLRRLKIDRIPLYYVHWPDGRTPIEEAMAALAKQRDAGKIAAVGVSNFSATQIRAAAEVTEIAAVQMQFSLINREVLAQVRPTLKELNIPLVAWGGLTKGLLTGKFSPQTQFAEDDNRHRDPDFLGARFLANLKVADGLKTLSTRLSRTPAQIAIRWLLDSPGTTAVLAGAKTTEQVLENCQASGWRLDDDDYKYLDRLADEPRLPAVN